MKIQSIKLILSIFSVIFVSSCGGGGGGGTSGILGGPSGGGGTTYTYSKIADGNLAEFDLTGKAVASAFSEETNLYYRSQLELTNSNLTVADGTDSSGNGFIDFKIDIFAEGAPPSGANNPIYWNLLYEFTVNDAFTLNNSPSHLYFQNYFNNADLIGYLIDDTPSHAGTEYVDMAIWWMRYYQAEDDYIAFVIGDKTFAGDMPTNLSATYNLKSMGFLMYRYNTYAYKGDGSITADFSNMTISGTLNNNYVTSSFYDWSQIPGVTAGTINMSGNISSSTFSGDVAWSGGYDGTGTFSGYFFGPNAKEIGGSYHAATNSEAAGNWILGTFIGAQ